MKSIEAFLHGVFVFVLSCFGVCTHDETYTSIDHERRRVFLRCWKCGRVSQGWTMDEYRTYNQERTEHHG